MGRVFPASSIPDTLNCPAGAHVFAIDRLEETLSNSDGDGNPRDPNKRQKLMYVAHLSTHEPVPGIAHREYFNIGSDEDPEATQPETWMANARRLKLFCSKAGIPMSQDVDIEELMSALHQQRVGGVVVVQKDTDRESRYYGQEQSRVATWFAPGERQPALDGALPTARPRPAVAPVPSPAAPARLPAAPAQRPAPVRTAPQPVAAAPARPPLAAAPAKEPVAKCAVCGVEVARSAFIAHVNGHADE